MKTMSTQTTIYHRLTELMGGRESFSRQLVRGGLGSLAVKLGATLLSLLVVVLLARSLGPEGYGIYVYVFALVSLLAIPAQVGLPTLVVRETAKTQVSEQWGMMRGLWRWSSLIAGITALVLALIACTLGWHYKVQFSIIQLTTFAYGLLLVPLVALGNLRGAALRGLRRIVIGQLPEAILRPVLLILLILGVLWLRPHWQFTAATAMGLHAVAATLAFVVGATLLWRVRPMQLLSHPTPEYTPKRWLLSALPLAFVASMNLINQYTDTLILGLFYSAVEVGIYRVAVSTAALVAFGLQAINMMILPHFARLHAQGDIVKMQHLVTQSARIILLLALPVALILTVFGEPLLKWIFGEEYVGSYIPLAILALGQLMNAFMGSVGALLSMTGYERDAARGVAIAAVINVLLNLLLIPPLGMLGAALATASSIVVWNIMLWRAVRYRIGINSLAFNFKTRDE